MDLARQVKREGICLLRLCGDLRDFIKAGRSRKTYLFETDEFLAYINDALSKLEAFIRESITPDIDPVLIDTLCARMSETVPCR